MIILMSMLSMIIRQKIREVLNNTELIAKIAKYGKVSKEFFAFTTSEGVKLNGWMIKPADFDKTKKYPVIMHQYSGPRKPAGC